MHRGEHATVLKRVRGLDHRLQPHGGHPQGHSLRGHRPPRIHSIVLLADGGPAGAGGGGGDRAPVAAARDLDQLASAQY